MSHWQVCFKFAVTPAIEFENSPVWNVTLYKRNNKVPCLWVCIAGFLSILKSFSHHVSCPSLHFQSLFFFFHCHCLNHLQDGQRWRLALLKAHLFSLYVQEKITNRHLPHTSKRPSWWDGHQRMHPPERVPVRSPTSCSVVPISLCFLRKLSLKSGEPGQAMTSLSYEYRR